MIPEVAQCPKCEEHNEIFYIDWNDDANGFPLECKRCGHEFWVNFVKDIRVEEYEVAL